MSCDPLRIDLSLVSHTNIGKTTLARTLLSRDIGEVADRAHVTETTDDFVLARSNEGGELILWDTPGFGNSVALARRLEGRTNPIGWFLSEFWDRLANKSQWLNQKALKHVRDTSSVVLYLVNATELPDSAPYVAAEMRILAWIGKPVIVLLNQMGAPRPQEQEAQDVARWNAAMKEHPIVSGVLAMDAFARCWVQEFALFDAIGQALSEEQQTTFETLREIWSRQRRAAYGSSMQALSHYLDRLINERELVAPVSVVDQLRRMSQRMHLKRSQNANDPEQAAQTALSARANDAFCALTDELLTINGLMGKGVRKEILRRMQTDWDVSEHVLPAQAALAGALGTGAVGGIATDLISGGLSMGLGTLIGGLLGALGGAGLAVAYNHHKEPEGTMLCWSDQAVKKFFLDAVLLYLAVAHFGRGRGNWVESECPAFWQESVLIALKDNPAETKHLPITFDPVIRSVLSQLYPTAVF